MRVQASLVEWKDEKGYGFARLPGGTDRVFVHAKSSQSRRTAPHKGDTIELDLIEGRKGPSAQNVRVLTAERNRPRPPFHVVTATMLFILVQLVIVLGNAPFGLVTYYTVMGARLDLSLWPRQAGGDRRIVADQRARSCCSSIFWAASSADCSPSSAIGTRRRSRASRPAFSPLSCCTPACWPRSARASSSGRSETRK